MLLIKSHNKYCNPGPLTIGQWTPKKKMGWRWPKKVFMFCLAAFQAKKPLKAKLHPKEEILLFFRLLHLLYRFWIHFFGGVGTWFCLSNLSRSSAPPSLCPQHSGTGHRSQKAARPFTKSSMGSQPWSCKESQLASLSKNADTGDLVKNRPEWGRCWILGQVSILLLKGSSYSIYSCWLLIFFIQPEYSILSIFIMLGIMTKAGFILLWHVGQ